MQQDDGQPWVPLSVPSDRRHGANWPLWRNWQELAAARQKSRILCQTNAYARGLLRNLTNYTIGKGFSYKATPRNGLPDADPEQPGQQQDERVTQLVAQLQAYLDRFARLTSLGRREREAYRRTKRDGEAFLRIAWSETCRCACVRFVEPEQVMDPPGASYAAGWSYGIQHQMVPLEDVETKLRYHLFWMDPTTAPTFTGQAPRVGEYVDAENLVHVMGADEDSTLARGYPEFSWDVLDALDRAAKLQRFNSIGATIRAGTAEVRKWATATRQEVTDFRQSASDGTSTDTSTGRSSTVQKVLPGTIRDLPAGVDLAELPQSAAAEHLQVAQGDLRQAGAAFGVPEYVISSDASNADYSSTKEAGAPLVKGAEAEQEHFRGKYLEVVLRAVALAIDAGVLPREVLQVAEVQATAPAVIHREPLEKAQRDQIQVQGGWKSRQTCAAEDGLDWQQEAANIVEYQDQFGPEGPPLEQPPDEPPDSPFPESRLREDAPKGGEFQKGGGRVGGKGDDAEAAKDAPQAKATFRAKARAVIRTIKERATVTLHNLAGKVVLADVIPIASDFARINSAKTPAAEALGVPVQDLCNVASRAIAAVWFKLRGKGRGAPLTQEATTEFNSEAARIDAVLELIQLHYDALGLKDSVLPSREEIAAALARERPVKEDAPKGGQFAKGGGHVPGTGGANAPGAPTEPKADTPSNQLRVATPEEHRAVLAKAHAKLKNAPQPSAAEVAAAKEGMARLGANKYRKNLIGNTKDRAKRRNALLAEFGDGKTCPCIYCATHITHGTLEQDKIFTTAQGGRYRTPNLVPACGDCNKRRGDMPFADALKKVARHAGTAP